MRHPRLRGFHHRGLLRQFLDWIRGREQLLVRAPGDQPLLLLTFPRGQRQAALEVEAAYLRTLPLLPSSVAQPYRRMLASLPPIVVVILRPFNLCGCLGHHHPRGTESRLARRLAADLSGDIGEIDLAFDGIRRWQPNPLSSLAAGPGDTLSQLHFRAALLTVLLHELEHLAFPDRQERDVRGSSDGFYRAVMRELLRAERGDDYGMAAQSGNS